jgi:hypothetical protein
MPAKPEESGQESTLSLTLWVVGLVIVAVGAAWALGVF